MRLVEVGLGAIEGAVVSVHGRGQDRHVAHSVGGGQRGLPAATPLSPLLCSRYVVTVVSFATGPERSPSCFSQVTTCWSPLSGIVRVWIHSPRS